MLASVVNLYIPLSSAFYFILFFSNFVFFALRLTEKFHLQGYTIPQGWKVLVWYRGIHLDPEIYENPKEFNPSRWEVSSTCGKF